MLKSIMATHSEEYLENISYKVIRVHNLYEMCCKKPFPRPLKFNQKIELRVDFDFDFGFPIIHFKLNSEANLEVSVHCEEPGTNGAFVQGWESIRFSGREHSLKLNDYEMMKATKYIAIALVADEPKVVTTIRCSSEKLSQALKHPGQFNKVTVICKGKPFVTNQGILSAWSPVFEVMFKGEDNLEAQSAEVVIDDFEAAVIKLFLGYLQGVEVPAKDLEKHAVNLYRIAHKYNVKELLKETENVIALTVNKTNFGDLLVMSQLYKSKTVQDATIKYAENNVGQVLESDVWKDFVGKVLK